MMGIRAGSEHRREPVARALAYFVAELLRDRHIGKPEGAAVRQYECAQVDGIAFAMFAQLADIDAVAAAAFEIIVGLDGTQGRAKLVGTRGRLVTQPRGDGFGKLATHYRRRLELDARAAGLQHSIEPQHVAAPAGIRADQPRHWLGDGDRLDALVAIGRFAGDTGGIKTGAGGFAEGLWFAPQRRPRVR